GALIEALEVMQAPRGSRVEVRCRGRSCPFRRKVRSAASNRRVRFREFEHRLSAGVLLQVFITKPGTIGKYTSFRIRASATPRPAPRPVIVAPPRPVVRPVVRPTPRPVIRRPAPRPVVRPAPRPAPKPKPRPAPGVSFVDTG